MKRGLVRTVQKLRPDLRHRRLSSELLRSRLGSRKKISTPKNIRKTLSAATRNTFSTLRCVVHVGSDESGPPRRQCSPACSKSSSRWSERFLSTRARSCPRRWASPARLRVPEAPGQRHQYSQGNSISHRCEPRSADRAQQEVRAGSESGKRATERGGSPCGRPRRRRRPAGTTPVRRRSR